jgi:hypothetical protein
MANDKGTNSAGIAGAPGAASSVRPAGDVAPARSVSTAGDVTTASSVSTAGDTGSSAPVLTGEQTNAPALAPHFAAPRTELPEDHPQVQAARAAVEKK